MCAWNNWQIGRWVLGVEADAQAVHLSGTTNSGGVPYPEAPGLNFTVTSFGNADWLFTARPRIGYVTPNNWLVYATGGLAVTKLQSEFAFKDNFIAVETGGLDSTRLGYAVGGGVEVPLTDRLSFKADYLHVDFAQASGATVFNNLLPTQVFAHASDFKADIARAGLNYRFGGADRMLGDASPMRFKAPAWQPLPLLNRDWELEAGTRVWFSSGSDGAPQPLLGFPPPPSQVVSRIAFGGLESMSGEAFARVDHGSGFFAKGYLGAGGANNGHMNDEDFPLAAAYSNTLSNASGHIGYATIDFGYDFLRAPGAKLGAFVGYNYYAQAFNAYGCAQLAGDPSCAPPLPNGLLGLTETDHFNSLRLGLSTEFMLTDRLRFSGEAAYAPRVMFDGQDGHLLRQFVLPLNSDAGSGVMLEAMLDYRLTDGWNVGIGARYWAWNMNTGTATFDFQDNSFPLSAQLSRFNTERYGAFVQTSYHWGDTTPSAVAGMLTKAPAMARAPMNWTGIYVGGHLGGGWSDARWSDSFGPTAAAFGFVNAAGFGDTTHATGPLAGGQIGVNQQIGRWVLGVEADAGWTDMRGENTCFSGLGGVNCAHDVDALGTLTGRVGFAWARSLAYVKGGAAWADTSYNINANTNGALTLGEGTTRLGTWGWTLGGGIEYALTDHWTTQIEYDHIDLAATTVPFPNVAVVNTQNTSIKQTVDVLRLGVNYKFDLASLAALGGQN